MTRCSTTFISVHASVRVLETHVCVDDGILAAKEEHSLFGVPGIRNLFVPQRVGGPVEVPLQEVGYAKLGTDEVLDDEVETLIEESVSGINAPAEDMDVRFYMAGI